MQQSKGDQATGHDQSADDSHLAAAETVAEEATGECPDHLATNPVTALGLGVLDGLGGC